MDHQGTTKKTRTWIKPAVGLAVVGFVAVCGGMGYSSFQRTKHPGHEASNPGEKAAEVSSRESGIVHAYAEAWESVQTKVDALARALEENEKLKLENANLRFKVESLHYDCQAREASAKTHSLAEKLNQATGSDVGRTLASIGYQPPEHLLPPQLFVLGMSYFKAKDYEKSAVIFSFLSSMKENKTYQDPRTYLLTATSWYHLDNFAQAEEYIQKILDTESGSGPSQYEVQARVLKALISRKQGRKLDTQEALRDVLDHHPHSSEAAWINRSGKRAPASDHHEKTDHVEKTDHGHHGHENHH